MSNGRRIRRQARRTPNLTSQYPKIPVALDVTIDSVSKAFKNVIKVEFRAMNSEIPQYLPEGYIDGQILNPEEATKYFNDLCVTLENEANSLAQKYSGARWLWYFRRISREFFGGRLPTTALSHHTLAETLSGFSNLQDDPGRILVNQTNSYPTTDDALRPVGRMAALAIVMAQCQSSLRRAGKGTFYVVRSDSFPDSVEDLPLESAIEVFDQRVANGGGVSWSQGLNSITTGFDPSDPPLLTIGIMSGPSPEITSWLGKIGDSKAIRLNAQFFIRPTSLGDLRNSLNIVGDNNFQWWPDELPSLVLLLQVAVQMIFGSEYMGVSIPMFGYVPTTRESLTTFIDLALPSLTPSLEKLFPGKVPKSGAEVINHLEAITGICRPFQTGPILRDFDGNVQIDLHAATQRLRHMITMPRDLGGVLVNIVSKQFELFVQDELNNSEFAPSDYLRKLRGRDLRKSSRTITDLDAAGQRDGKLLIVSCKNIPFTERYNAGEHSIVRNVEQRLDQSVSELDEVLATLRQYPVGDNYDFSSYHEIIGVVVTPHVMFSRSNNTNSFIGPDASLRKASSVGELLKYVYRK